MRLVFFVQVIFGIKYPSLAEVADEEGEKTTWSYKDPNDWRAAFPKCGGSKQSPIDLKDAKVADVGEIEVHNFDRLLSGTLSNNGHTLKFALNENFTVQPFISGGRLDNKRFAFVQMHWHWGSTSEAGSEHTVEGRRYPMEVHLVHKNTKYDTLEAALNKEDGLAVLGSFYEVSKDDNPLLEDIVEGCDNVQQAGGKVAASVVLNHFLPMDTRDYFYYQGGLTTPTCNEAVLWTNFLRTTAISERQLDKFRNLLSSDRNPLADNFRPTQQLNHRQLLVTACSGGDSCCSKNFPCDIGEGDCDSDSDCAGDLKCGNDNCNKLSIGFDSTDDCCQQDSVDIAEEEATTLSLKDPVIEVPSSWNISDHYMYKIKQNYHEDCEELVNKQINVQFHASYVYLSMFAYFSGSEKALHGFASFFANQSEEAQNRAVQLIAYQNKRGGRVDFRDIIKPVLMKWGTCLDTMKAAFQMEKAVNENLLELAKKADVQGDFHLLNFLDEFIKDQVVSIKSIGETITKLERVGNSFGIFLLDKELAV